jgi:hypothetical protein
MGNLFGKAGVKEDGQQKTSAKRFQRSSSERRGGLILAFGRRGKQVRRFSGNNRFPDGRLDGRPFPRI